MAIKRTKVAFSLSILALIIAFFSLVSLNNLFLDRYRLDLTQGDIYSISPNSLAILKEIKEPINFYFFFSDKTTEGLTPLRSYAKRVENLLREYQRYSDNKIKLQIIDPQPFSEAEDRAAQLGLTAVPLSTVGDNAYFGLAATNGLDETEVIGFFDPSQESLLEYDISKLIYRLSQAQVPKVTLISGLPVMGGPNPNPMAMQMGEPQFVSSWVAFSQLQHLYQVELLPEGTQEIPQDTEVLVIVHPKGLSDPVTYAIDQYVMAGGKALVFVDPLAESDSQQPGAMGIPEASNSNLDPLFKAWGLEYQADSIVIDAAKGLEIVMPSGQPGRHAGYLGLERENIDGVDVVTNVLSSINGASMGAIFPAQGATTSFQPLLQSSDYVDFTSANEYLMASDDPEKLLDNFTPLEQPLTLAARITGPAKSAFNRVPEGQAQQEYIASSDNIQLIVVADTDILTDGFWVQVSDFFGQQVLQPFANNGDFLINAVDNLAGSDELLAIRGKTIYQRPFDRVEALTVEAEAKFREQEQLLQAQLEQTENQLAQLQQQQGDSGNLVLSEQQQQTIDEFIAKKLEIRQQLREVRHQLDKDIEALGTWLKLINIAVLPIALTLLLALVARWLRRRARLELSS